MIGQKLHMTNSKFSQSVIHILNHLTKIMFYCSLYKNMYVLDYLFLDYVCFCKSGFTLANLGCIIRVSKVGERGFFTKLNNWGSFNKQSVSMHDSCGKNITNPFYSCFFCCSLLYIYVIMA